MCQKPPETVCPSPALRQPGDAPDPALVPLAFPKEADDAPAGPGEGWKVVLFNDDIHSMDQVVHQLMAALRCGFDHAAHIMMRAHTRGSAVVIIADRAEADRVAGVLRQIGLLVEVGPA